YHVLRTVTHEAILLRSDSILAQDGDSRWGQQFCCAGILMGRRYGLLRKSRKTGTGPVGLWRSPRSMTVARGVTQRASAAEVSRPFATWGCGLMRAGRAGGAGAALE